MPNTIIIGSGSYLPEKRIDGKHFINSHFYTDKGDKITDKTTSEIIEKFINITEIKERRYVEDHQLNSELGYYAAQKAIEDAQIDPETLDYIIYANNFGDVRNGFFDFMPNMAARVKHQLGIKNRKCINYDMIFGCPGWVEGMILADNLIKAKVAKNILVIGGDTLSKVTDPYDRNKMIFADGAGAVVVTASQEENIGIISKNTICDNDDALCYLSNETSLNKEEKSGRLYINMQGRKIYEYALKYVPDAIKQTIDDAHLSIKDIDKILIHQANAKMDHAIIKRLMRLYDIKDYDDSIAPMTIQKLGNSSVATIPTMFDLIRKGKMERHTFQEKGNIVFASVGAGMNINAIVYKFN